MEEESSSTEGVSDRDDGEIKQKGRGSSINRRSSDESDRERRSTEIQHPPEKADKKKKKKKKSRKPSNSAFKQQRLKSCQPILTPIPVILTLGLTCVAFVLLGILILITSYSIVEAAVRYDNCSPKGVNTFCNITLEIERDMKSPVYIYYKLTNYYQNHRSYVKSRYDDQLKGHYSDSYSTLDSYCDPLTSKDDSHNPDDFYIPCGLIALSFFNDTYVIYDPYGVPVNLTKRGIAWSSDKEYKFANPHQNNLKGIHTVKDLLDEDFIVWMRTAGLPTFKKLWRKSHDDWPAGTYTIEVQNRYDVSDFDGEKWLVVGESRWIGGRNEFLGIAFIVVGGLCGLVAVVFGVKHLFCPRKLGDEKYLKWK